ncbi:MAG: 50S ribosomal protein L28 [Candidatus Campbellbacteria bacterium]|nr:50S ribosomal protein L28 [Candidatus Campbellbacteria bacterium]
MSKECVITGATTLTAGRYSNRTRATQFNPGVKRGKKRRKANLQKRKLFIPELGKSVHVVVSNRGMKTIRKNGAYAALKKVGALK